jgi:murein L,D-transpeptidase YafK
MENLLSSLAAIALGLWEALAAPVSLDGPVDRVLVAKSDRELFLVQDGRVVRMYPISLGFSPEGDKERQGDGRTPEGLFRIDRRNEQSAYHLSLGLDYPHPEDVQRASERGYSPGGDIFIHGQPPGIEGPHWLEMDWTAGCIAVSNAVIEEIWDAVPIGTQVEIIP